MILILITSLYKLHWFIVMKGEQVSGIFFETYFGVLSVPDLITPTLSGKAICSHVHHSGEWIWLWPFWFWPFWSVAVLDVIRVASASAVCIGFNIIA